MTATTKQQAWVNRVLRRFFDHRPADTTPPLAEAAPAQANAPAALSERTAPEVSTTPPQAQVAPAQISTPVAQKGRAASALSTIVAATDQSEALDALTAYVGRSDGADPDRMRDQWTTQLNAVGGALRKAYADTLAPVDASALSTIVAATDQSEALDALTAYVGPSDGADPDRQRDQWTTQLKTVGGALRKAYADTLAPVDASALSTIVAATDQSEALDALTAYVGPSDGADLDRQRDQWTTQLNAVGGALRKAYAALLESVDLELP